MAHRQIKRFRTSELILPRQPTSGVGGHVRMEAFQCREMMNGQSIEIPGTRRVIAEFDNNVTHLGLDHIGHRRQYMGFCHVGEGNAAESAADTTLDDFVAGVGYTTAFSSTFAQGSAPYYGGRQRKYRFVANFGGGAVNIAEVGLSTQVGTGQLGTRALVKDGMGDPTVVPVSATEYLDVFYTMRNYPGHLTDGSGTIVVDSVSYNYDIRAAEVDYWLYWGYSIQNGASWSSSPGGGPFALHYGCYGTGATLGSVTGLPTASSSFLHSTTSGSSGFSYGTYVDSTYFQTFEYYMGFTAGNVTGNIKAMMYSTALGSYQILFNNPIPKNSGTELYISQSTSWSRKVL